MAFLRKHPLVVAVIVMLLVALVAQLVAKSETEALALTALIIAVFAYMDVTRLKAEENQQRGSDSAQSAEGESGGAEE